MKSLLPGCKVRICTSHMNCVLVIHELFFSRSAVQRIVNMHFVAHATFGFRVARRLAESQSTVLYVALRKRTYIF
jgi:hypothetical protein